jgi:hypothetical protein
MVGKNPFHLPASTGEMPQLHAPSLPADHSLCRKESHARNSFAKAAPDGLVRAEERSLGLVSESRIRGMVPFFAWRLSSFPHLRRAYLFAVVNPVG